MQIPRRAHAPPGPVAASRRRCENARPTTHDRRKETHLADDQLLARGACAALVITCSDFRFKTAERAFLKAQGLADDYDLIARPGAARALVAPREDASRQTMLDEIRLLWELHRFTRILLLNHMSCRAYDDLATGDAQRSVHEAHLRAAAAEVERRFDGVAAEPHLVALVDAALRVGRVE